MPFALVLIGIVLVITGAQGTQKELVEELKSDFTGPGNFTYWIFSLGVVGALGYIESLRGFSRAFMALIIITMIIRNGAFFDKFKEALDKGPEEISAEPEAEPSSVLDSIIDEIKGPLFKSYDPSKGYRR